MKWFPTWEDFPTELADLVCLSSECIDALAIGAALWAAHASLARRDTSPAGRSSFELAAVRVNGVILLIIGTWILVEALPTTDVHAHHAVDGSTMIAVALMRLVLSSGIAVMLTRHARHNLNLHAVRLHSIADALGSAGLLIGSVLITVTHIHGIDALIAGLIALVILRNGVHLLRAASRSAV